MQIVVELDEYELAHAAMAGCQRRIASILKARPQVYGAGERKNYWQIDIIGMIAEYAVAKAFDKHWQPATNQRLSDLPGDVSYYQVRSTEHRDGHLFIHPQDKDAPFILAIVVERHVLLTGWLTRTEGLLVGENRSADTWWVRQDQLNGFELWPDLVAWSDMVRPKG